MTLYYVWENQGVGLVFDGTKVSGMHEAGDPRHSDRVTLGYADGHVGRLGADEFAATPLQPRDK